MPAVLQHDITVKAVDGGIWRIRSCLKGFSVIGVFAFIKNASDSCFRLLFGKPLRSVNILNVLGTQTYFGVILPIFPDN